MALNMHYALPELFTKAEITLHLKDSVKKVEPDLDQNVVEFTIDIPDSEVIKRDKFEEKRVPVADLPPGLHDDGYTWVFKGDPVKIT
ncbi:hypothetical protein FPK36_22920, partial [Acinetobacter baumannii]|nr:hypothetical protein [Acinetobacter baumannii]